MGIEYKDYYKILGVSRDAKLTDIRKAYRKLAKQYHPDVSQEKNAEEKYKEINEAYEVLKDPEKRKKYDALGMNWQSGQDFTPPPEWQWTSTNINGDLGGFSDFFQTLFGNAGSFEDLISGFAGTSRTSKRSYSRKPAKSEYETSITLTLEEIFQGGVKKLVFRNGNSEKTLNVRLPKGLKEGSHIKLSGQADDGGDIFITVHIAEHPLYKVNEYDLTRDFTISIFDSVLAKSVKVETLKGNVDIKIPAGIHDGQKLRLRGLGLPKRDDENGDLYLEIKVSIPQKLTAKQKKLWEELEKLN